MGILICATKRSQLSNQEQFEYIFSILSTVPEQNKHSAYILDMMQKKPELFQADILNQLYSELYSVGYRNQTEKEIKKIEQYKKTKKKLEQIQLTETWENENIDIEQLLQNI